MHVVLGDVGQSLRWYPAATCDVLQERQHLLGAFGATEGQQQDGVKVSVP
jgi:hypothetical protein